METRVVDEQSLTRIFVRTQRDGGTVRIWLDETDLSSSDGRNSTFFSRASILVQTGLQLPVQGVQLDEMACFRP